MNDRNTHRLHAALTFTLIVVGAGVLLPLVRSQPESAHKYFNGLNSWIRIGFTFSLCVVFTGVMFKLLSPRIGHLAHWKAYPPAWLAALLAWIMVAFIDLIGGFDTEGYRATVCEWLGYGGGSFLIIGWYFGLWSESVQRFRKEEGGQVKATKGITLQDIEKAPWEEIEAWLESDEPAGYDFLGNQSVAHRVSFLISEGARSIGIVGPYGAGKTSIVGWVSNRLRRHQIGGRLYFVCQHSCWGFETSASAIHDLLGSAISKLSVEIDTFQVDSLPESYRQTFAAGGDWVETISNLVLRNPDPMEQFSRLSDLLSNIRGCLIFIVEDLDRNETSKFEIQEVLAFLERLKEYSNLSFILTGGLSSSQRIDYAKLCDHIEFLRTVQPKQSASLINRIRQRCLDNTVFPHVRLGDPNRDYDWNPLAGLLMRDHEEFSFPQAISSLLNTPRSLRHALGRTFFAWRTLHGEIDFNQLLAVNILRFGSPECFQFLMRRWDRLNSIPNPAPSFGQDRINGIRQAILDDWNRTIQSVEWNPTAALQVMQFILPATEFWLVDNSRRGHSQIGQQYVSEERYWIRAMNEAIDADDVRDQEVIRDIQAWLQSPNTATGLVTKLTTLPHYSDIWENLAGSFFANRRDQILMLCEQVVQRILSEQATSASGDSQGFIHTWRFANRNVGDHESNSSWIQSRISEAASVSLKMVVDLWYYYGSTRQFFIRPKDMEGIRRHLLDVVKACVPDGESLIARLSPNASATLYQLVFDPGHDNQPIHADVQSWKWLGPMILDAIRTRDVSVTANCGVLLGARVSFRERMAVDTEVLDQFFGGDANEVVDIIEAMIDQFPEVDQSLVRNVVGAARQHLSGGTASGEHEREIDVN